MAIIDLDGGCDLTLISIVDSASYAKTINSLSQLFPPSELLLAKTTSDAPLRHTLASYLPEADSAFVLFEMFLPPIKKF
ncbi:MAG: hypothetical protein Q8P67_12660 [archaeon]|nr:hypothetical protein [archaeon]